MGKWLTVHGIGDMEIESKLLYMDYPILFVARSGKDIFLIENIDNDEGIFLASKTTYRKIYALMTGKRDIRTTIIGSDKLFYINYCSSKDRYTSMPVKGNEISDEDLPDKNTYFTLDDANTKKYLNFVLLMILSQDFKRKAGSKKSDITSYSSSFSIEHNSVSTLFVGVSGKKTLSFGKPKKCVVESKSRVVPSAMLNAVSNVPISL